MKQSRLLLAAVLLLVAGVVQAQGVRPFFSMALTGGGDNLLTIVSGSGSDDISAGGLLSMSFGAKLPMADPNLEGRVSFGYFFDIQSYSNGDASFDRFPLESLLMYRSGQMFWLGGGITYHINPTLSCNITAVCSGDISFDNALGVILQTDWLVTNSILVGLRYTSIEYDGPLGSTADGSHIGLIGTFLY